VLQGPQRVPKVLAYEFNAGQQVPFPRAFFVRGEVAKLSPGFPSGVGLAHAGRRQVIDALFEMESQFLVEVPGQTAAAEQVQKSSRQAHACLRR
jgi:hypothetical protein